MQFDTDLPKRVAQGWGVAFSLFQNMFIFISLRYATTYSRLSEEAAKLTTIITLFAVLHYKIE